MNSWVTLTSGVRKGPADRPAALAARLGEELGFPGPSKMLSVVDLSSILSLSVSLLSVLVVVGQLAEARRCIESKDSLLVSGK